MSNANGQVQIRKIPPETIAKLNRLAAQSKNSRENYLRRLLVRHTESIELMEQRFMYEELVERLTKALEVSNELTEAMYAELNDIKLELAFLKSNNR